MFHKPKIFFKKIRLEWAIYVIFTLLLMTFLISYEKLFKNFPGSFNLYEISLLRYSIVFILYLISIFVIQHLQNSLKKITLAASSLIFATILFGVWMFLLYIIAYLFYRLLYIRLKVYLKISLLLLSYLFFIFFYFRILHYSYRIPLFYIYIFATLFPLRFILFFYYSVAADFKKEPFIDYILYIFFPTYFIIHPHTVILPKYDYFRDSFSTKDNFLQTVKSGIKHLATGLLLLFMCSIIYYTLFLLHLDIAKDVGIKVSPFRTVVILLAICGYGDFQLGMIKGFGYNIKSPFRKPFFSRDIIDFFNRFLIYFKEYIVSIFFLPLLILTKSLNRYSALLISAIIAIVLGSALYTFLGLGVRFCAIANSKILNVRVLSPEDISRVSHIGFNMLRGAFIATILGCQLIWNYAVNNAGGKLLIIKKINDNIIIKLLKIIAMIGVVFYIYR